MDLVVEDQGTALVPSIGRHYPPRKVKSIVEIADDGKTCLGD